MPLDEHIRILLEDVGTILDVLIIDEYPEEHFWHIALDAQTIFFAELDEQRGVLTLSCDVGSARSGDRAALYEMLLTYGHHWDITAGARLSLSAPDGPIWLWSDMAVNVLNRTMFAAWLNDYRRKIAAWKEIIERHDRQPTREADRLEFYSEQGFIRG